MSLIVLQLLRNPVIHNSYRVFMTKPVPTSSCLVRKVARHPAGRKTKPVKGWIKLLVKAHYALT